MGSYFGDLKAGATITVPFTTNAATGAAVAPLTAYETADFKIYKGNSTTERASVAGITITSPFDAITGLHMLTIDTSDNTDAGFYAAGNDYHVILSADTETVDSQIVVAHLFTFSIQNRGGGFSRQMTENYAADGVAPSPEQALFMIQQALTEFAISGTTQTVKKLDGSTSAAVLTLNSATAPTSVTRTA